MSDFDTIDYFTSLSLVPDPYEYFEHLRAQGPVVALPRAGVVAVTGFDEALSVYRDTDTFSSCNAVAGPFPRRPFEPDADDVSALIDQHRHSMPMGEYLITQDPPAHAAQRGLLMRLLTPRRMRENEAFTWGLANRQIDTFVDRGSFEVLAQLAGATYPDGALPEVDVVVRTATFLFAAGQDTTTRLLSWGLKLLAEQPGLQDVLRQDRSRIPNIIEEVLRIESPVKSDFRMARRSTSLAGVEVPAGTTVMILPGATNRDPRHFECPHEVRADRANAAAHLSFGRGIHSCPGGPLSRIEVRVSLERLLDRLGDLRISEAHHGPAGARRFDYEPTYILRGLTALHLDFTAIGATP